MPVDASATPLVNIIIPCYNAERFVGEAVRSALEQTYPHREIIVVNDGSTDGSLEVLKSFGNAIRLETGPNRGGCAARNRGLALARGELVQFLDADDMLHTKKLEKQVPLVLASPDRICYCDFQYIDEQGSPVTGMGVVDRNCEGVDPVVLVVARCGLSTPAPIHWRENLIKVGGFREFLTCAQERDLHIRLACHGLGFRHLAEPLVTIRQVGGSVSSQFVKILDQHEDILLNAKTLLEKAGTLTDERREAMASLLASDGRNYLKHGEKGKSLRYFRLAKEIHPDGGISMAYGGMSRVVHRLFGPVVTHRLGQMLRGSK